ncbi:MAG: serine/threonine protein kinase [Pirellulaceae bacterium]|nr:MAG: serine/threonine protein kinase [Pirellulaceae bacterium]
MRAATTTMPGDAVLRLLSTAWQCWNGGLVLSLVLAATAGCTRRTFVDEVSVEASGVTVKDVSHDHLRDQWPMWRGPTNDGIAPEGQDPPTHWSTSENVRWVADVPGRGHASPVVVSDRVILATAIEPLEQQLVVAYARDTGDLVFQTLIHEGNFPRRNEVHQKASHANSTVACDGSRIYATFFHAGSITTTALDMEGNIVWRQDLGPFISKFGYAPSPLLYQSLVIVAADHSGGGFLVALDSETGRVAWRVARPPGASCSSPMIARIDGQDRIFLCGCDQVVAYDPHTGRRVWSANETTETTCGTMVAWNGMVYASGGYPRSQTVALSHDGVKLWDNRIKVYEPSLLVTDGHVYAISDNGIAYCWSATDGRERWKHRLGGNFSASPVLCNDKIFVSNLSGKHFVLAANPEEFQEIAVNSLGDDCYASPAIVGGDIFLRLGMGIGEQRREKLVCLRRASDN